MIENGKVPLIFQLLESFYKWEVSAVADSSLFDAAATVTKLDVPQLKKKINQFEYSIGTLLFCCLMNKEVLLFFIKVIFN